MYHFASWVWQNTMTAVHTYQKLNKTQGNHKPDFVSKGALIHLFFGCSWANWRDNYPLPYQLFVLPLQEGTPCSHSYLCEWQLPTLFQRQFHAVHSTNLVVAQTDKGYSYEWFCKYILKSSNPNREARTSPRINHLFSLNKIPIGGCTNP